MSGPPWPRDVGRCPGTRRHSRRAARRGRGAWHRPRGAPGGRPAPGRGSRHRPCVPCRRRSRPRRGHSRRMSSRPRLWPGSPPSAVHWSSPSAPPTSLQTMPRERRFRATLAAAGGGTLDASVRHDPTGAARRLLARAAWLPDLAGCVTIQGDLPAGWIAVPRDGSAVVTDIDGHARNDRIGPRAAGRVGETGRRGCATRDRGRRRSRSQPGKQTRRPLPAGSPPRRLGPPKTVRTLPAGPRRRPSGWLPASSRRSSVRLPGMRRRPNGWPRSWNVHARRSMRSVPRACRRRAQRQCRRGSPRARPSGNPADAGNPAIAAWEARAAEIRTRRDRLAEDAATRDAARPRCRTPPRPSRGGFAPRRRTHRPCRA